MNTEVRPGIIRAWLLAARPKTLAATVVPVAVGGAVAWHDGSFRFFPVFCCFMFAILAQIAANFANDYFDFKHGVDTEDRVGPDRALSNGWISARAMIWGMILTLGLACCFGLLLLPYGGWKLVYVGAAAALFCLLYSAGPYPLANIGLGDLLVIAFFGIIAIAFTVYVQTETFALPTWSVALAFGLATDNILVANNYRDRDTDRAHQKYTSIVLLGEWFGRCLYLFNGLAATGLICLYFYMKENTGWPIFVALSFYLLIHVRTWYQMIRLQKAQLNQILGASARNLVLLGTLFVGIICFLEK